MENRGWVVRGVDSVLSLKLWFKSATTLNGLESLFLKNFGITPLAAITEKKGNECLTKCEVQNLQSLKNIDGKHVTWTKNSLIFATHYAGCSVSLVTWPPEDANLLKKHGCPLQILLVFCSKLVGNLQSKYSKNGVTKILVFWILTNCIYCRQCLQTGTHWNRSLQEGKLNKLSNRAQVE